MRAFPSASAALAAAVTSTFALATPVRAQTISAPYDEPIIASGSERDDGEQADKLD